MRKKVINSKYWTGILFAALIPVIFSGCSSVASSQNNTLLNPIDITVSAAASLTDAITEADNVFTTQHPEVRIHTNFGSSGTLQAQIENGAPVDAFISAAPTQMDNLQKKDLLLNDTRINLFGNKVVIIVPADSTLGISDFNGLAAKTVLKIAIGDPKSVPAGTYAQQAIDELGIAAVVNPKEVLGGDVRQVLTYVESKNVDAGIVYSTDAMTSTKVKIAASAPDEINAKIVYPAAVIKASKHPDAAKAYLEFLSSRQAGAIFEKYGFTIFAN